MAAGKKEKYVLALDHGTSGCKVALVTIHGSVVDFDSEGTPISFLPGGGAEQDPADWWNAFLKSAKRLLKRNPDLVPRVESVCVSSTFSSTVAVGRDGTPLMNSLTWMDARGARYIRELAGGFPNVQGYGLGKVLRWIRTTGGGPSLSGKDDIAHVILTEREYPDIYERTHKFLGSKDYFNLRLTGEFAATHDSITLFWVTDNRKINDIRYSDALIRELGIDREKLPPLVRSVDVIGTLRPSVAKELGLSAGVRVFGGSPDHQSALVGSGAVRDYEGHLYIGTSSWVECIVPFKKTDMFHSIASLPSAIPGRYQCINEQDIAGGALDFLLNNIIFHRSHFYTAKRPKDPYARLDETVAGVPPGSNRMIFAPWLNGERSPVDSTTLRGILFNISMTSNTDQIVRAVLEGVAYNTRWSLRYVERFAGKRMAPLNIIGGGARSRAWCGILADVLGREIRRVKNPVQANARGAAFIASVGAGNISFENIPDLVEYDSVFYPDGVRGAVYNELYGEFVNLYRKNRGIFGRLNRG
ncbi:MAG: FGGY-family carbohydrate kinase [Spirochaetes bacterium]|nr:FGGY-family carbohydrate kinase [Spirochaetota bacterium]